MQRHGGGCDVLGAPIWELTLLSSNEQLGCQHQRRGHQQPGSLGKGRSTAL